MALGLFAPVLGLVFLLACGGGSTVSPVNTAQPAVPATWQAPVDLAASGYLSGASLAGDGKGGALAAWTRFGTDASGAIYREQVAARLRADGTWESTQVLESTTLTNSLQDPVVALDAQGKGQVGWLSVLPRSTTTVLRRVPVDLAAAAALGPQASPLSLELKSPTGLRLAVGSDGSALAAWQGLRTTSLVTDFPTVQSARLAPGAGWGVQTTYSLAPLAAQGIQVVTGDRLGGFLLEFGTGDDTVMEAQAVALTPGTGTPVGVDGWQPLSQVGLPAVYQSAWDTDAQGNQEAWLLFAQGGVEDAQRQAWPRTRTAAGTWTARAKVLLPLPASSLALFREGSSGGWVAGLGSAGLWVAPLNGLTPGAPKTLLPPTTTTEVLVAVRDATGRPALLWIQRGVAGIGEGIGFSRWDGTAWTTPAILPGTAGKGIQRLLTVAGPGGLLAAWVEVGDRVLLFRTALWK